MEELDDLPSGDKIKKYGVSDVHMKKKKYLSRVLVGKPKGTKSLRTPKHRCKCNSTMDRQEG
jgi:hypothetical protein